MSNSPIASASYRPARRSTRLDQAIPLRVEGVDSYRGPYSEEVSTVSVSAHGCKYRSKNQVLTNALVILELKPEKAEAKTVSARGRVKWVTGPHDHSGLFETAIELEDPGNVWGIAAPPKDWLPFSGPRTIEIDTAKSKPFAVPRNEPAQAISPAQPPVHDVAPSNADRSAKSASANGESGARQSLASVARPVGQLMGDFQQQMEHMLSEVATAAVREKTSAMLNDVHTKLRQEAKSILTEATASQAGPWIEQALKQMKLAGQESARALHTQWTKKIEADLASALQQLDIRQREMEELSKSLATNALQKVEGILETSRKDGVDRLVARLKEQIAPIVDDTRKAAADLAKRKEAVDKILEQSVEQSSIRIEETCTRFERQFEMIIRERIDAAREELAHAGATATELVLNNLRISSQQHQTEAQAQLRDKLNGVAQSALKDVEEKAAATSQEFAGEMKSYSRSHLEYVSSAISELAKGIGKLSKD